MQIPLYTLIVCKFDPLRLTLTIHTDEILSFFSFAFNRFLGL